MTTWADEAHPEPMDESMLGMGHTLWPEADRAFGGKGAMREMERAAS